LASCCGPGRRPAGGARASLTPAYFVLLAWDGERVMHIRDFRYTRYATKGAELVGGAVKGQ
jgi:hypothetical protein